MSRSTWIVAGIAFVAALALGSYLRRLNRLSETQRRRADPSRLREWDDEEDD